MLFILKNEHVDMINLFVVNFPTLQTELKSKYTFDNSPQTQIVCEWKKTRKSENEKDTVNEA